jgi:hypothetical protein
MRFQVGLFDSCNRKPSVQDEADDGIGDKMKVHKLEVIIIDFDEIGAESIKTILENARYPNHCISPIVRSVETRDIGEWSDDNPLNRHDTIDAEIDRLFTKKQ